MARTVEGMVRLTGIEEYTADVNRPATTNPDAMDLIITESSEGGVYEAVLGGETVAGVVYSTAGNRVTLRATSVFPGKGIAAWLLKGVLDRLRIQGETVSASCPLAAAFVSAHPEYADILDSAVPGISPLLGADMGSETPHHVRERSHSRGRALASPRHRGGEERHEDH
jgi:predicted GNAT family acetyltransferase